MLAAGMLDFLITGAGGNLGSVVLGELERAGASALGLSSAGGPRPVQGAVRPLELCDAAATERLLRELRPRQVLHLAALSAPLEVLRDPVAAARINVDVPARLAALCAELDARFVFASSDLVFAGDAAPYTESAEPRPLSVYGAQKLAAERAVLAANPGALLARLPLLYGLPEVRRAPSFFLHMTRQLRDGAKLALFSDELRTPLDYPSASAALRCVAESTLSGAMHLGGPESVSRLELGVELARVLGCQPAQIEPISLREVSLPEPRPPNVSLVSERYARAFGAAPGRPLRDVLAELAGPLARWHAAL
jgi:dTDP-4-dehydrorhamnose reductase